MLATLVGVLALVAAGILIEAGHESNVGSGGETELRSGSLSAEAFVDSIGVVVHFVYTDTAYARQAELLARMRELGIRHVREGMPEGRAPLIAGLTAARAAGIRATLVGEADSDPEAAVAESVAVMGDAIDAFEGPNELDNLGDPAWATRLADYMPRLAAARDAHAAGVPLIGPSLVDAGNRSRIPRDLPGLFNAHPYAGGLPPSPRSRRPWSSDA